MTLKTIQIQTGAGKTEENNKTEEEAKINEVVQEEEEDSSSTFSSSSSISLDFVDEACKAEVLQLSLIHI